MNASASGVQWMPAVEHEAITLVIVAPDGTTFTRDFAAGNAPTFRLQDLPSKAPDGAYTYELRVTPLLNADVKHQLAAARQDGDDAAIERIQHANGLDRAITQSGTLTVVNGSIINSNAIEPPAGGARPIAAATASTTSGTASTRPGINPGTMDVVTADDEIIQGSLCVGLDCVVNESFGFDTIRLKENNTRIKFDDTSTSTGFPNNDWQLTANDSASGGANKFSIDDITGSKTPFTITAGAPTNSLFVASTGKVGFGNASPGLNLHITATDTPAIRQEQTNGGGFTAQTWDIGANEANWFVRDVTGGSRLPLRIRPGAPTSSIDISASGLVGIGTASPSARLYVSNTAGTPGLVVAGTNSWINFSDNNNYLGGGTYFRTTGAGAANAYIDGTTGNSYFSAQGGNVGIGTSSPSSKLEVNGGDIRVTGGSFIDDGVTVVAPDYVFETSYNLMPLSQLSNFIQAEKHLPNVPSAKDIKANGINLSQFQMRLLEKVEELTLYTLDQHSQISALKSENQQLLDRLSALEKKVSQKE